MLNRIVASCAAAGLVLVAATALIVTTVGARTAAGAPAACHPAVSLIARGQGSPDDLAWDGNRLLVSDIDHGTIGTVVGGHVKTLIGHIQEPEGVVPLSQRTLVVAEQQTNRLLLVDLQRRSITPILRLPLPHGQTGVDDIEAARGGGIYVPNSATGRLYLLRGTRLRLLAGGMTRPVAALDWRSGVAVPDEYANVVWMIRRGERTRVANVPVPDDLAVVANHLIAVSLVDQVWEVAPHLRMLPTHFHNPQGLVADGRDAILVADQATNGIYRVSRLAACL